jgi:hypothetical protein
MTQNWDPEAARVNELRLRYVRDAYRRGFTMGVSAATACGILITLALHFLKQLT